ncbi:MAG TPA: hypothetical protein VHV32_16870 [Candidatus Angelobacter sp.]|nr:hypothetical protein [Candidatus Angelobacter sp.]
MFSLLGAPSFWWLIASLLIAIAGIIGAFKATAMVGVAFPPLASITPLILSANVWNKGSIGLLSALVAAWGSVVGGLAVSEAGLRPILKYVVASFAIIAVGFGIDRAFTNRIHLHEFEMNWAVGSSDRLQAGPDSLKGEEKVIIYRRQGENTCYDTIYSNKLANYLTGLRKPTVHVEYEAFYDFGRERGYNVRSIEGMLITKNQKPVLDAEGQGGMFGDGSTGACDR